MRKYTAWCITCARIIAELFEGSLCDKAAEEHIKKQKHHRVIVGHMFPMK